MENKIQELTEKLLKEGVEKGNAEAEKIIAAANEKAAKIVADAKAQAVEIEASAKKNRGTLTRVSSSSCGNLILPRR